MAVRVVISFLFFAFCCITASVLAQDNKIKNNPEWPYLEPPLHLPKDERHARARKVRRKNTEVLQRLAKILFQDGGEAQLCSGTMAEFPPWPLTSRDDYKFDSNDESNKPLHSMSQESQYSEMKGRVPLDSDAGSLLRLPRPRIGPQLFERIRWFHAPKTGSGFINTILFYACPAIRSRANDIYLGARIPKDLEFLLGPHERRHHLAAQDLEVLAKHFCPKEDSHFFRAKRLDRTLAAWSTHLPVIDGNGLVGLFRSPDQRLVSSYHFHRHLWGSEMQPGGGKRFYRWRHHIHNKRNISMRDFLSTPGVAGCYGKMLHGCYCASRPLSLIPDASAVKNGPSISSFNESSKEDMKQVQRSSSYSVACSWTNMTLNQELAESAAAVVRFMMHFVGLQEFYNASICLFHRTFGGAPHPSEFTLFNVGSQHDEQYRRDRYLSSLRAPGHRESPASLESSSHRAQGSSSHRVAVPGSPLFENLYKRAQRSRGVALWYDLETASTNDSPATAPNKDAEKRTETHTIGDFVDVIDEIVYSAALDRFEEDVTAALAYIQRLSQASAVGSTEITSSDHTSSRSVNMEEIPSERLLSQRLRERHREWRRWIELDGTKFGGKYSSINPKSTQTSLQKHYESLSRKTKRLVMRHRMQMARERKHETSTQPVGLK